MCITLWSDITEDFLILHNVAKVEITQSNYEVTFTNDNSLRYDIHSYHLTEFTYK